MFCGVNPASFEMHNLVFDDNVVEGYRTAMNCMNIWGGSIQRNTFTDIRYGLYVNLRGTEADPVEVRDNVFTGVLTGVGLNLAGPAWGAPLADAHVEVMGNTFNYNEVVYESLYPAVWLDPDVDAATIAVHGNRFVDGGANAIPAPALQNESGTGEVNAEYN
jgi:hypothetical protein